jgi:hypothetical protein
LSACQPCQPASLVSLSALTACLLCFVPAISASISKWFFAVATNMTNINNEIARIGHESVYLNEMSMVAIVVGLLCPCCQDSQFYVQLKIKMGIQNTSYEQSKICLW